MKSRYGMTITLSRNMDHEREFSLGRTINWRRICGETSVQSRPFRSARVID